MPLDLPNVLDSVEKEEKLWAKTGSKESSMQ
jgi:hypothetical protein